ncbi:MAG: hypothetical protein ACLRY6_13145 [[Clostridium] innocuum]
MRIHQASLKRRIQIPKAVREIVERKLAKQQEVAQKTAGKAVAIS